MNHRVLYQWSEDIANHLTCLNSWQIDNVSLFSMGIIQAESCQQHQVARQVATGERIDSCARRWRRFLDNEKFPLSQFFTQLTKWLVDQLGEKEIVLLVDETKLADRLGAMVVGIAWEQRCIPVAWRCYQANDSQAYPAEGQVKMIGTLLQAVRAGIDESIKVTVMADRGIGTSPALCRCVANLGWHYLFRVTCQTKVCTSDGEFTIAQMVSQGEEWSCDGKVFKTRGRLEARALAVWSHGYDEPWALVTNNFSISALNYGNRNWEEQAFRDLKSGGWQWQSCRISHPDHLERLLVLLTLAYAWCIALGSQAIKNNKGRTLQKHADGAVRRYWSLFKEGLQYFFEVILRETEFITFAFTPDPRMT